MSESSSSSGFAYRAFISYSHRDRAWGDWLHKALETYRVPARLVGKVTAHGTIPRRLNPIFRDREEFASATDLGRKVDSALGQSENLIVICSPASAGSRWVNEEVLAYKRMGRADRIFCLIVGGEPNASDMPGREAEECFCPALRFAADAGGPAIAEPAEPIAADARPGKDGKGNAKLKLIAGMLDVGFDALKQREQRRQLQRMTAITAMAVCVMAVTIVLAIAALIARHDAVIAQHKSVIAEQAAERRQKQAEGLVGFMLGDLSDKLDQVHRLDIMQAVDDKAMAYFNSLPAADATDAALEMRVKALDKVGLAMTEANGQLAAAAKAYRSAAILAAELARRAPGDESREVALGESVNMVGMAYWQEGDLTHALRNWESASTLFGKAHATAPSDSKATSDLASVRSNIGHILESRGDFTGAQTEYEASLKLYQSLAARSPANTDWQSDMSWGWDNLGKLALERGQLDQAIAAYLSEHRIKAVLAKDAGNHNAQADFLVSNAILGRTLAWCGNLELGLRYTEEAVAETKALLAFSSSTDWQEDFALYSQQAGALLRQYKESSQAADADHEAIRTLESLLDKDPISSDFQRELSQAQLENARLLISQGNTAAAASTTQSALDAVEKLRVKAPEDRNNLLVAAQAHLLLGQLAALHDDSASAQREWAQARDLLQPSLHSGNDPNFLAAYAEALLRLDQMDAAQPIVAKLNWMGYRTPDFVALAASKRLDYPVNAEFQSRIAQIMQGDSPQTLETANAKLAGERH